MKLFILAVSLAILLTYANAGLKDDNKITNIVRFSMQILIPT